MARKVRKMAIFNGAQTPATFDAATARAALLARAEQGGLAVTDLSRVLGLPRRTLYRVLGATVLSWETADRVAVALGRHPCELWPSWFGGPPAQPAARNAAGRQ